MADESLFLAWRIYLLTVPFVSALNGLSMHLSGISVLGPAFHAAFTIGLLGAALLSPGVPKAWGRIGVAYGSFLALVGVQLALGHSSVEDLPTLYKWFLPMLLFSTYARWSYLGQPAVRARMIRTLRVVPILYSSLMLISFVVYLTTGFEATLFDPGAHRFTGFNWAYNPVVNVFFISAYLSFILAPQPARMTLSEGAAFLLLRSKTAAVYYLLMGAGLGRRLYGKARRWGALRGPLIAGALAVSLVLGARQTFSAMDLYGAGLVSAARGDAGQLAEVAAGTRTLLALFALEDIPTWPAVNLLTGNGMNVDRRLENPRWAAVVGMKKYGEASITKEDKTSELDVLGMLDLFGLWGLACLAYFFFVLPFREIRLPWFRTFYLVIVGLSLLGGHMLNNPQAASVLVATLLCLRWMSGGPARASVRELELGGAVNRPA
ncbi:MAG: hypothetical protein HY700_06470 [Gemmatimonadetes bacterium]|nr:hypothetical protein [Gemmatimonadota bacterium]